MKKIIGTLFLLFCSSVITVAQTDTTQNDLRGWKLIDGYLIEPISLDTVVTGFQVINPIERFSVSNSWLGNMGSAWKSNVFFTETPIYNSDFIFDKNFQPYVFSKENQIFYHAKKPYFDITWTTATKKRNENQLSALYTQNINKKWNVGMQYKLIASDGEFPNALISENSLNAFTSYTGERYSLHAAFMRNKFKSQENGGIIDTISPEPEFAQAYLPSASSIYFDKSFFLSQEYRIGYSQKIVINDTTTESTFNELVRLNHVFSYKDNYRIFQDEDPQSDFYKTPPLIDTIFTRDSIRLVKIENALFWTFKEIKRPNFNGRLTVGGALENLKWVNTNNYQAVDSISVDGTKTYYSDADSLMLNTTYNNFRLMANLDARTKMFVFSAKAHYYLSDIFGTSNKADNYSGDLLISKGIIVGKQKSDFFIKLHLSNTNPSIFEEHYYSNHFQWDTSFYAVLRTEGRVGLNIPAIRTKAEFAYAIINNYIYFDDEALPRQYDKVFNIMSLRLHKDFKFGHFYSRNKVVYQILPDAANELNGVIRLPDWAIYHSFYFDLNLLEKIGVEAQLGYDLNYTSRFQAQGYMPATGQFYQADGIYTGHYPILNVFLNMRIKTVLLSFKFEHINNQFLLNKYYFAVDKYAINTTAFKFGVSWRFRD